MKQALVKPLATNGNGGNGIGHPPPPPPPPPTLSIAITSPAENAKVVGYIGSSVTIVCTVTLDGLLLNLDGLVPDHQWTDSISVSVRLGSESKLATLTSGSIYVNGATTWTCTASAPSSGAIIVNASVTLNYGIWVPPGGGTMSRSAAYITLEPSGVSLGVSSPS